MELDFNYRKLIVYSKSKDLVKSTYSLLKKFPKEEQYALCDQIRRAVISVPSNIVEGNARASGKEKARFFDIAYGSLMESLCQLEIAKELHYISNEELLSIELQVQEIAKLLSALRLKYLSSKL